MDKIYDMPVLPDYRALELFSLYAFGEKHPTKDFIGLSNQVVNCLQGHPLALKVLGGWLYDKPMKVWQSGVDKLQEYPNAEIQKMLRPSYEGLDSDQKRIFLDIACSFIGENRDLVVSVLDSDDCFVNASMEVLVDKSLISISRDDNSLQMHGLIQSMAREIVREESIWPGHRSRLWILSDVKNVLNENKATETIEVLDLLQEESSEKVHIDGKAFAHMKNLRILKICHKKLRHVQHGFDRKAYYGFDFKLWNDFKVNYSGRLSFLSNKLRLFYWHGCLFKFFPSDFYPENIVAIDLSYSRIENLWTTPKCFRRLKVMKLSHCRNLESTPDFTRITNLEELILEGCVNLVKFHPSFGMLKKLVILNMRDCKRFTRFPYKIEMDSLEVLHLSGCSKVDKLPEFFGTIQTLREFSVDGTAITELPTFVFSQRNLQILEFGRREEKRSRWWTSLSQPSWLPSKIQHPQSLVMPSSLANLCFLRELKLRHCNISQVSDSIGGLSCLERLYLDGNNFTSFPAGCLSQLSYLEYLSVVGCKKLEVLPQFPPNLVCLKARFCPSLHELQGKFSCNNSSTTAMFLEGCPQLFKNLSVESQLCMLQPRPDLNLSITNQISYFLQIMEVPSNTCRIFKRCVNIMYHGNIIPKWFTNTSTGNHIKVELPPNFCYNKVRGYGICVVLTPKNSYGHKNYHIPPRYYVDNFDTTSLLPRTYEKWYLINFHVSDIISFCFMNKENREWEVAKKFVTFSIEANDDFEVKACGVRLVFDEDIHGEETCLSITLDLSTAQDGSLLSYSVW